MREERPPHSTTPAILSMRVFMWLFLVVLMRAQGVPLQPLAVAVRVVFLLPDRGTPLDLFDDIATGREGGVAMRRSSRDDDTDAADGQAPRCVHDAEAESLGSVSAGFLAYFTEGAPGHDFVRVV